MEKIWLKEYQAGVPNEINPDIYSSINEMFEEVCNLYQGRPSFTNFGALINYQELESYTRNFAAFLQKVLKLKKGERVAIILPNVLQYPVAMFGVLRAGLTVVNVNPLYTNRELERQLKDSECSTVIVLANFAAHLQEILPNTSIKHVIVTEMGDLLPFPKSFLMNFVIKYIKKFIPTFIIKNVVAFRDALRLGEAQVFEKPVVTGEDIAFLQYTGGTTGTTKGAMLTHRNMIANIEQASAWIKPMAALGKEIIITALPLYHVFSLTANCLIFFKVGALNVLITNPRDIKGFIKTLSQFPFTAITGVNTLFNALLNHPKFNKLNFSHLKIALGGGMAIQHSVAEKWKYLTKTPIIEAYGLTETAPAVCINPLNIKDFNGSVGLPISSTEIAIWDEENKECSFNEVGELMVRGPQVMKGYWNKPEETEKVLSIDGWLRTGDLATVDNLGYVRIVDRKKDMIIISGFNVYPNEVEDVVAMMPEVSEVAIVGIHYGDEERVKAFIVKKDENLSEKMITEHCRKLLTAYKIPREIEFVQELPKTNVGKILRRVLRSGSGVKNEDHS